MGQHWNQLDHGDRLICWFRWNRSRKHIILGVNSKWYLLVSFGEWTIHCWAPWIALTDLLDYEIEPDLWPGENAGLLYKLTVRSVGNQIPNLQHLPHWFSTSLKLSTAVFKFQVDSKGLADKKIAMFFIGVGSSNPTLDLRFFAVCKPQ